jgi:osmotically-inducible protein OsmY
VSRGASGLSGSGLSSTGQLSTSSYAGASSVGTRRAVSYITEMALDTPPPPRSPAAVRSNLQAILSSSSRLPSAGNIRVSTTPEGVVVLRGRVATARERRLAESILRLSPGVTVVRNELRVSSR